jgi:hypothetical protein
MKKKIFRTCLYVSAVLFLGFIGLYVYVWVAPEINGGWDWHSISIGHGKISIAHPAMPDPTKFWGDDGRNFHVSATKDVSSDMSGCYLVFFNQNIPFYGVRIFGFADGDKMIGKTGFRGYGMEFGSSIHTTNMFDCSTNDRASETIFLGYGILYFDLSHSIDKDKTWWTLMISLWYPIILFAILPAIFIIKKIAQPQIRFNSKGNR